MISISGFSQLSEKEQKLLFNHEHKEARFEPRKPEYIFRNNGFLVKYNPVSLSLGALMYGYQKFISAQISAGCGYEISCSRFSVLLLREHGVFKGIPLSADRLMRCNSISIKDISHIMVGLESRKIMDDLNSYRFKK